MICTMEDRGHPSIYNSSSADATQAIKTAPFLLHEIEFDLHIQTIGKGVGSM